MFDEQGRTIYRGQEALDKFAEGLGRRIREANKLHYKTTFQNLPISIENRKGSVRKGVDDDGSEWKTKMKVPYGYIRGTEGPDGDGVDVFVGPNEDAACAYIIHCNDPESGEFDEDKVMLGFDSSKKAKEVFLQHYDDPKFFGGIDEIPMWKFSDKVFIKKHTVKKLVASCRESIPGHVGATGLDQSMKKAILGHHQDIMVNPEVRETASLQLPEDMLEHGVKGMKWGIRHVRKDVGRPGARGGKSKRSAHGHRVVKRNVPIQKRDLANDPKTMSMMSATQGTLKALNDLHVKQQNADRQAQAWGQRPNSPVQNHGEALSIMKSLGWGVLKSFANLAGLGGAVNTITSVVRSPSGQKAHLNTDRASGRHSLATDRPPRRRREARTFESKLGSFLMEAKRSPGIYYAREMGRYGTDAEDGDLDKIREAFPGDRVNFSKTRRHNELGMGYFHDKIDKAKAVVIRPTRGNRLTAGVFSEAQHALHRKIPVYALYKGELRRVKRAKVLSNPNNRGHFGKITFRKKKG